MFELGKKYKMRKLDDWAMFVGKVPEGINADYPLIFYHNKGTVVIRDCEGRLYKDREHESDVLPEEWVESFNPRIGMWKCRDGALRAVLGFCRVEGLRYMVGVGRSWRADGRYYSDRESSVDLIEYIGPLEKQYTEWEE